ncbi:NADH-quinone oxidoreductase subunit NuoK [Luteipulveratus sp. YIM 133132]|uniref:NADH-quinone oxidoreductase subunit K n=1 Tax=Luteipulveratus flavus TaxID=3031728 RepID=A0ABT6C6Q6_9MICO|nr:MULTISPECIES: NADH-quinone oxidoreductase subunit NuoK [unclassified Luteipulveratus]MDE9365139.1 NADH-quinone oxidoreductase subunit NuoK [Luteipulveratus sp. YIM 133132]MDF8264525.1 NADH-quinone oxidoreductase subunit NuoK [Luteipulveratus sp. YIM 133296]
MIHLELPLLLVAVLAGTGVYGILARRNAVLVLIGVELVLASAGLLMVTMGSTLADPLRAGHVLTIFVITIAAAEIAVALALVVAVFRARGDIDVTRAGEVDS